MLSFSFSPFTAELPFSPISEEHETHAAKRENLNDGQNQPAPAIEKNSSAEVSKRAEISKRRRERKKSINSWSGVGLNQGETEAIGSLVPLSMPATAPLPPSFNNVSGAKVSLKMDELTMALLLDDLANRKQELKLYLETRGKEGMLWKRDKLVLF